MREGVIMGIGQAVSMLKEAVDSTESYSAEITAVMYDEWGPEGAAHNVQEVEEFAGKTFSFSSVEGFIEELARVLNIEKDEMLAPKPNDGDEGGVVCSWVGDEEMEVDDSGEWLYDVNCQIFDSEGEVLDGASLMAFCDGE